jgi:hypothetical protein
MSVRGGMAAAVLCLGVLVALSVSSEPAPASGRRAVNEKRPPDVDIDGDGLADLVIGNGLGPGEALHVMYGDGARQRITPGSLRPRRDYSGFGATMVVCDVNGDRFSDVVVGTPDANVGGVVSAGRVVVLYGASSGLQAGETSRGDVCSCCWRRR